MKRILRIALVATIFLIGFMFVITLLTSTAQPAIHPAYTGKQYTPAYHGADLLEICPGGSITAWWFDRKEGRYKFLFKREGKRV